MKFLIAILLISSSPANASPEGPPESTQRDSVQAMGDVFLISQISASSVHHVSHILRGHFDTNNWVLMALEPVQLGMWWYDVGPAVWIPVDAALLLFSANGHIMNLPAAIDPLEDEVRQWAEGDNKLGVKSPRAGRLFVAATGAMLLARAGHLTTSIIEASRYGFSLKRRRPTASSSSIAVVPTGDGAQVMYAVRF